MTVSQRTGRSVGRLPRILLSLLALVWALIQTSGGSTWRGVDRLDAALQDVRLRMTLPRTLDTRIVIVDIDEKSQTAIGRWPWRRDHLARLLDELFDRQQVALVGFGQVFDTPDDSSGLARLRHLAAHELRDVPALAPRLRALASRLDYDAQLARALSGRPVVLGYQFHRDASSGATGVLPAPVLTSDSWSGQTVQVSQWSSYRANIAPLAAAAPVAGFLDPQIDPDGRVRAMPMLAVHEGRYHEALALAMFRLFLGSPPIEPGFPAPSLVARYRGLEYLHLRQGATSVSVPVGQGVMARLPFRGLSGAHGGSFRYVSASDLLTGRLPEGSLQGALILVGATAAGLDTRYLTPVGADYPGIELHASLLSGLLDGRLPVRPDYAAGYGLLVVLGAGLLLALALPVLSVGWGTLLFAAVTAGIVGLNVWLSVAAGLTLPLAPALLMVAGIFALGLGYDYAVERRARRDLTRLFGAYVPPELVREMVRDPGHYGMQAVSQNLTVLFCDIRGFTQLSEGLEPIAVQSFLNRVLSRLTDVIGRHGGTIDKYMGDCVMAFWGAPLDRPDHARRAVAAALDLSQAVRVLNDEHRGQGLPEIEVGIGVNTGPMCVGDMGSPARRAYTVVGDAVNLAARLERLSAQYGVTVLVGEMTRREADDFDWLELDKVRLKGKVRAVTVYTPCRPGAPAHAAANDELRTWSALLKAYRAQDVSSCDRLLATLGTMPRTGPTPVRYALYAHRVAAMRGQPVDPEWDGATRVNA
jgi:adenylate cyclase